MKFHRQLIHQHDLQSHLHCGNDPTVTNYNGILSTANARNTGETPFTMRNRSVHDPNMIRPHTRPSRNRRTAEVDHRGSGTDFVWKNIGFRVSAISQKHISCETSFKSPSATHPPAPLAIPFTLQERPTVTNHNGILSTANARNTGATPFTMRNRSAHDPNMIRTWSDHTRNRLATVAPQRQIIEVRGRTLYGKP